MFGHVLLLEGVPAFWCMILCETLPKIRDEGQRKEERKRKNICVAGESKAMNALSVSARVIFTVTAALKRK